MKKIKKFINRKESVVTGKKNLKSLYSFKNFPVFMGCVTQKPEKDLVADMDWTIDPDTGVIQLTRLLPLDILYQAQHVDGTGPTWQKYYEDFGRYIKKQKIRSVLEIGGGQGKLAEIVITKTSGIKWTIIEPHPIVKNKKIRVISKFFDTDFKTKEKYDAVVFSQLLEHIYSPSDFLKTIYNFLDKDGIVIFAYPNLEKWLKKKYTNAINFEHTMFLTDYYLDYLIKINGFKILDKRKYKDHSHFYTLKKDSLGCKIKLPKSKYGKYKKIFMDFVNYHKKMVNQLNKKIERTKDPVYLFGAHIFSQYLIGFGLKTDKIVNILDNSPLKQDKRLYGTDLIVKSPKILKNVKNVNVILKAGAYNQEIKKDILENINSTVKFW
jgi:SAM-dependent methyltransferase